jgi:hypothetical protein
VYTIERWVRDWYGLNLCTDRPEWRQIAPTAVKAAAHAAGFVTALDIAHPISGLPAALLRPNRFRARPITRDR